MFTADVTDTPFSRNTTHLEISKCLKGSDNTSNILFKAQSECYDHNSDRTDRTLRWITLEATITKGKLYVTLMPH